MGEGSAISAESKEDDIVAKAKVADVSCVEPIETSNLKESVDTGTEKCLSSSLVSGENKINEDKAALLCTTEEDKKKEEDLQQKPVQNQNEISSSSLPNEAKDTSSSQLISSKPPKSP